MNKKLIAGLIAVILITPTTAAAEKHATGAKNTGVVNSTSTIPSLVIIDTALDTSLPAFKGKIVYEVCIVDYASCANGGTYMEGPGAAGMPSNFINRNGFEHGTQMTSVAIKSNPNMNIVFIRIVSHNALGQRKPVSKKVLSDSLTWAYSNRDKFNIQAIAMSQGSHMLEKTADYCPKDAATTAAVELLASVNIPSFFAVGNNRDYKRINWPACIPTAIAIGAIDQIREIASSSNYDLLLDFYAEGFAVALMPGGGEKYIVGTSPATQVAASQYIAIKTAKPTNTLKEIYNLIIRTSTVAKSGRVPFGKAINLQAALVG